MGKPEITSLYDGKVKLEFDPKRHVYTVGDKIVDGCTSILGVIAKPALVYWSANKAAEYIDENLPVGKAIDEVEKVKLVDGAKYAHRQRSKEAADIGTIVHNNIHEYVKSKVEGTNYKEPVNKEVKKCVEAFKKWEKLNDVKFKYTERKVYSKELNVAGTLDLACEVKGKRVVGDIKTSSGIYEEMWLQVNFYRKALTEEYPDLKIDHVLIIRTGKDGSLEIKEANNYEEDIKAFKGALDLHRRLKEMKYQEYLNTYQLKAEEK